MLDPSIVPLLYLCSLAGLIMISGGIFLIYKEKIYIDKETNQVTVVETPVGKFRTNSPALALFVLGFIPLVYPIYFVKGEEEKISISGELTGNSFPVHVYAVAESESLVSAGEYKFTVPARSPSGKYKIIFYTNNIFLEESANLETASEGKIEMGQKDIQAPNPVTFRAVIEEVPEGF